MPQATLICLSVEHTSTNDGLATSTCPDTVVFSLDEAFFKGLGESLAAVRLLSAASGELTIPMPTLAAYFQGCPIDQAGTVQVLGHDWLESGDLSLFSLPGYKQFGDPSEASDWDAVGTDDGDTEPDSSKFDPSSTWLIVDQHGFQIESMEAHSDEKATSMASFVDFPQIADRIEAAVLDAYQSWGIEGDPTQRQSDAKQAQASRERG